MTVGGSYRKGQHVTVTGYTEPNSGFFPVIREHDKPAFVSHDYLHEISEGIIPNHFPVHLVGLKDGITDTEADFTTISGTIRIPDPTVAEQMKILSTSSQDDTGGTGAFTLEVHGLDTNNDLIDEVISLNGTSKVTTVNTYLRINDTHVMSVGTNFSNVGDIYLQSSGDTIYRNILAGNNNDLNVHFTVPRSLNAFITGWGAGGLTGNTTTKGRVVLKSTTDPSDRSNNTGVDYIERAIEFKDSSIYQNFRVDIKVAPCSQIRGRAVRAEGASSVTANMGVDLYLDPDDLDI